MSAFISSLKSIDDIESIDPLGSSRVPSETRKVKPYCVDPSWKEIALACLCPGVVLGHMSSMLAREPILFSCRGIQLGNKGCETCLQSSVMCAFGWPFPLCLSYKLLVQRSSLRSAYNEVISQSRSEKCREVASICCLWPCVLEQHYRYLQDKADQGILLFDWETEPEVILDKSRPPPNALTYRVVVLGAHDCGKTLFSRKLLQASNSHSSGNPNTLQVGYRPLRVSSSTVEFLEVWDSPSTNLSTSERNLIVSNSNAIILLYDISNVDSFRYVAELFEELMDLEFSSRPIYVVANKVDLVWKNRELCDQLDSTMEAIREKLKFELLEFAKLSVHAKEWCRYRNVNYVEVSALTNFNIMICMRNITKQNADS